MVWLRQSAAHNWPVTSTQQDSIQAQTRQESTWPFGKYTNIYQILFACYKNRKAYSRLFTNSILDYGEGGGGLCRSKVAAASHRVPGWASPWALQSTKLCYRKRHLILLVEELHLVAQATEKLVHPALLSVRELF